MTLYRPSLRTKASWNVTPNPRNGRQKGALNAGHSLVELMVALPLLTAIVIAAGGLIMVASKSRMLSEGLVADKLTTVTTSQHILNDLQFATSVADKSSTAIEFSVPDRDGDGIEDTIRYSWSGTLGDPLKYSINQSPAIDLADDVNEFALSYVNNSTTLSTRLQSHDDASGGTFNIQSIIAGEPVSQYFKPILPNDATQWSLEKIRLLLRSFGTPDGEISVSVSSIDAALQPIDKYYEQMRISETQLDSEFGWVDVTFWNVKNLPSTTAVCIVINHETGTDAAAQTQFEADGTKMSADTHFMTSNNNGMTWTLPNNSQDLRFYAIGTHNGTLTNRSVIGQIQVVLQVGSDNQVETMSKTRLLNQPEIKVQ